jgi:hypothetical protein
MSYRKRINLLLLTLLIGLLLPWGLIQAASASKISPGAVAESLFATPTSLPKQPPLVSPDISFIDSPTASCILPRSNTGTCYITWSYLFADATPNYMITMTVGIDDKALARYSGFFQASMYVPSELLVFRVPCGASGSGGNPDFGANHSYVLRARDSAGISAANYGSVSCPADEPARTYLPILRR